MASQTRDYKCDNGHEFSVLNWGTPPLRCPTPNCTAGYKPLVRQRQRVSGYTRAQAGSLCFIFLFAFWPMNWQARHHAHPRQTLHVDYRPCGPSTPWACVHP